MFANFLSLTGWPVHHSFSLQNYFARNFYNMRMLALFVAFAINFILLFYKVCVCVSLGVRDRSKSPMTPMDRFPLGAATEPVYTNSKLHFNKRESPKLSSITDAQEGRVYVLLGE